MLKFFMILQNLQPSPQTQGSQTSRAPPDRGGVRFFSRAKRAITILPKKLPDFEKSGFPFGGRDVSGVENRDTPPKEEGVSLIWGGGHGKSL